MCNRPKRKRDFEADLGALSGADMCPASDAAVYMPRARMVFAGRVQIKAACSKALCCTLVLPIPSHDCCAKLLLALFRSDVLATYSGLMPLRPELVAEVVYDQVTGQRFRHGTTFLRWRPDKAPRQCTMEQLEHELRPAALAELLEPA